MDPKRKKIQIQLLDKKHIRDYFSCGVALLDQYLKKQASQDVKRGLSACTVLVDQDLKVIGYYTLSSNAVKRESLPDSLRSKLPPSYVDLPYILLGRLAVDEKHKGKGFGELLLLDALNKCVKISKELGVIGVVVDPIDSKAISFYGSYGFQLLPDSGKMVISIKTIENL